ncbi:MAG: hypothetical protein WC058_02810 [Phycisphaeraceae bacterium]
MAWESRIADESARRLALAVVMLTLLGGSVALAMWMTVSRRPEYDPGRPTHPLGRFEFALPGNWRVSESPSGRWGRGGEQGRAISFQADPPDTSQLNIVELSDHHWRVPLSAIIDVRNQQMPGMASVDEQTLGYGPLSVLRQGLLQQGRMPDGRIVTRKHVLAAATVDGQSYLVFDLTGWGELRSTDIYLIQQIALSVTDTRYTRVEGRSVTMANARIVLPEHLLALRPNDATGAEPAEDSGSGGGGDSGGGGVSVLIAPESSTQFYRMHLSVVETQLLRKQWEEQGIAEAKTAPTAKLIEAQLKARYLTANNRRPPISAIRTLNLGTRKVQVIVLDDARRHGWQREWWATELDEQHVLMLELLADVRAIGVANQSAVMLVRDIETDAPGNQPPASNPPENPAP